MDGARAAMCITAIAVVPRRGGVRRKGRASKHSAICHTLTGRHRKHSTVCFSDDEMPRALPRGYLPGIGNTGPSTPPSAIRRWTTHPAELEKQKDSVLWSSPLARPILGPQAVEGCAFGITCAK